MSNTTTLLDFTDNSKSILSVNGLYNKLHDFINDWQNCAKTQFSAKMQQSELNHFTLNGFISDIIPLLSTIKDERCNGDSVNVWEVAGLGYDEVRISSVFAWFLNCHAEHGQGSTLLSAIIDKLPKKPNQFPFSETIQSKPYWLYVESCASGELSSRIDIEIESEEFLLFIEVKVFAGETNNQLERYIEIAGQKAGKRRWGIIYLTPNGKPPSIVHPMLLSISWKDIADVFHSHAKLNLPVQSYSGRLISQFAKHISNF
jgi:hypothetical protein